MCAATNNGASDALKSKGKKKTVMRYQVGMVLVTDTSVHVSHFPC